MVVFDTGRLSDIAILCAEYVAIGLYYYIFLQNVLMKRSDEYSCRWPDLYQYIKDSITNNIVFSYWILFRPSITLNSAKFIQRGDSISLCTSTTNTVMTGPFDFEPISSVNRTDPKSCLG